MRYIATLGQSKSRFKELEKALWENVDILVPGYMSMEVWTRTITNLRESNAEHDREVGGNEDPLMAIREFLGGSA